MTLYCPECNSDKVVSSNTQLFYVNTGDHYCHAMKAHDFNSPSKCLDCDWKGIREELVEGM